MARIFMQHSVEDYTKWRAVYDADTPRRDNIGIRQIGVYREADHPNEMLLVFDIDRSVTEAKTVFAQMSADPELQAAMQKGGVKAPPQAWIVD